MTIDELETPTAVVDLDVVAANLAKMRDYARKHGLKVRPHTKTHKIPAIARMQVDAGCYGLTVAKVGEAEVMSAADPDDILVAYPIMSEGKSKRLALLARDRHVTVAIDSIAAAEWISRSAAAADVEIGILIEIDVGMRRCGLSSPSDARNLALAVEKLPRVRFKGITFYPGHIWLKPEQQAPALNDVSERIARVIEDLREAGLDCEVVSGGSTPTAFQSHVIPSLTEIRPGTYVFNDRNTMGVGACELRDCALRVLVTVISDAVPGRAIVDGGSKTFSNDPWLSGDHIGYGLVVENPHLIVESLSEEHGHIDCSQSRTRPRIGERLSIIPNHVCTCVNLHDSIWYHKQGIVQGCWHVEGRGMIR